MIHKANSIGKLLREQAGKGSDRLIIRPLPALDELEKSGSASIDLRLGTWFVSLRHSRLAALEVDDSKNAEEDNLKLSKLQYVPFGRAFYLQPGAFVLGVTLEWVRFPCNLAGYVIGRSSWGRRGLIIATAAGVHPGFTGCLTLELTNVGEIPIAIKPGIHICQLFIHTTDENGFVDKSHFVGLRQPKLGRIELDSVARILAKGPQKTVPGITD